MHGRAGIVVALVTAVALLVSAPGAEAGGARQPTFAPPVLVPLGDCSEDRCGAGTVLFADVDRDGVQDMIALAADASSTDIVVLLGDGHGGFAEHARPEVGMESLGGVAVGDVNGDAAPDIVYTGGGAEPAAIWVALGDGTGAFAPPRAFDTPDVFTYTPAIADLNGDGIGDIAVAAARAVYLLLGDRQSRFGDVVPIATGDLPLSLAIADLDDDSHPDLVVTNGFSDTVSVLRGDGAGAFAPPDSFPVGGDGPVGVVVGAVNGDQVPDVVVGDVVTPGLSVLRGTGGGALAPVAQLPLSGTPYSMGIADFNGDGANDVLAGTTAGVSKSAVSIFPGDGQGGFSAPIPVADGVGGYATVVDLNADGKPDLAVGGPRGVSLLLNTTSSTGSDMAVHGEGARDTQRCSPDGSLCTFRMHGTLGGVQFAGGSYAGLARVSRVAPTGNGQGGFCWPTQGHLSLTDGPDGAVLREHFRGTTCEIGPDRPNAPSVLTARYAVRGGKGRFASTGGGGTLTIRTRRGGDQTLAETGVVAHG